MKTTKKLNKSKLTQLKTTKAISPVNLNRIKGGKADGICVIDNIDK